VIWSLNLCLPHIFFDVFLILVYLFSVCATNKVRGISIGR